MLLLVASRSASHRKCSSQKCESVDDLVIPNRPVAIRQAVGEARPPLRPRQRQPTSRTAAIGSGRARLSATSVGFFLLYAGRLCAVSGRSCRRQRTIPLAWHGDHQARSLVSSLQWGRVEEEGLRCCYHGWLYDTRGSASTCRARPRSSPSAWMSGTRPIRRRNMAGWCSSTWPAPAATAACTVLIDGRAARSCVTG